VTPGRIVVDEHLVDEERTPLLGVALCYPQRPDHDPVDLDRVDRVVDRVEAGGQERREIGGGLLRRIVFVDTPGLDHVLRVCQL